jgi:surface antigen
MVRNRPMKPVLLVGLAAAALLMLAACNSGGSDTPAPSQAPAASASPDASAPANTAPANTTPLISGASADLGTGPEKLIGDKLAGILGGDDRQSAALAATQAASLPMGQKVTWQGTSNATSNPATGWASPVGAPYRDSAGRSCRFVQQSATHGSDSASDTLKICNGSGGWVPA